MLGRQREHSVRSAAGATAHPPPTTDSSASIEIEIEVRSHSLPYRRLIVSRCVPLSIAMLVASWLWRPRVRCCPPLPVCCRIRVEVSAEHHAPSAPKWGPWNHQLNRSRQGDPSYIFVLWRMARCEMDTQPGGRRSRTQRIATETQQPKKNRFAFRSRP